MKTFIVVLVMVASAQVLQAQEWCSTKAPQPGSYADCSLRIVDDQLIRGQGETVAMAGPFSGFPLRRFVVGDSAARYAARYERNAFGLGATRFVGGAGLLAGCIMVLTHVTEHQSPVARTGRVLMLSAMAIHYVSVPLQGRVDADADQAVAWHNRTLREAH